MYDNNEFKGDIMKFVLKKGQSYSTICPSGTRYKFYKDQDGKSIPVEVEKKEDIERLKELDEFVAILGQENIKKESKPISVATIKPMENSIEAPKPNGKIEEIENEKIENKGTKTIVTMKPEETPMSMNENDIVEKTDNNKIHSKIELEEDEEKLSPKDIEKKEINEGNKIAMKTPTKVNFDELKDDFVDLKDNKNKKDK